MAGKGSSVSGSMMFGLGWPLPPSPPLSCPCWFCCNFGVAGEDWRPLSPLLSSRPLLEHAFPRLIRLWVGSRLVSGGQPLPWNFDASKFIPLPSSGTCAISLAPSVVARSMLKGSIPLSTTEPEVDMSLVCAPKFESGREWAVKDRLKSNCHKVRVRIAIYW